MLKILSILIMVIGVIIWCAAIIIKSRHYDRYQPGIEDMPPPEKLDPKVDAPQLRDE